MTIRIALADDHAMFREGLRALLERQEDLCVVAEAGSGAEACRIVREAELDVLVLDLNLPGLGGEGVAELALETRPELAIVVLTMHEDEYYLRALLRIGARGFVLKKSTATDVVQAIRAAHGGRRYIDPSLAGIVISGHVDDPRKCRRRRAKLTRRERQVCSLLAHGYTNAEVAVKLCISRRTVETHRSHIMERLQLRGRADLVRFAIDHGLLELP